MKPQTVNTVWNMWDVQEPITILVALTPGDRRQELVALLTAEFQSVLTADDAQQTIDLAVEHAPDVILLSGTLTDGESGHFCRQIRSLSGLATASIVLLADEDEAEYMRLALECGADDIVRSPFDLPLLTVRVRTLAQVTSYRRRQNERMVFHHMVDHAALGVVTVDRIGTISYANEAFCRLLTVEDGDALLGQNISALIAANSGEAWLGCLRRTLADGGVRLPVALDLVRTDGTDVHVEIMPNLLEVNGHPGLQLNVVDCTARRQREEELRGVHVDLLEMSGHVMNQSASRRRADSLNLAHSVQQPLRELTELLDAMDDSSTGPAQLQATRDLVQKAMTGLEEKLCLTPFVMLGETGLGAALTALAENFQARGAAIHFEQQIDGERYSPAVEDTAYRYVADVLRHASEQKKAPNLSIFVWSERDVLTIQIESATKNFNMGTFLAGEHILDTFTEIQTLGGVLEANDAASGSSLLIELPVEA